MPTYDEAMQALRAADAAGNTEDARRLAEIANRLKPSASEKKTPSQESSAPSKAEDSDSSAGFISGNLNRGIASRLGLPMDLMGAGMGFFGRELGFFNDAQGRKGPVPEGLSPQNIVGGSGWIEDKFRKAGLIGDSADPQSMLGKMGAGALQMLPSVFMGMPGMSPRAPQMSRVPGAKGAGTLATQQPSIPRPTLNQMPRAITGAATSGAGAELGAAIAPEGHEREGAILGALAPGARGMAKTPSKGERATAARKAERFGQAKEAGIPVAPREMKPDKPQQKLQDGLNRDLKLPEGSEITPQSMKSYRAQQFEDGWQPLLTEKGFGGKFTGGREFRADVDAIIKEMTPEKGFRTAADKELIKTLNNFKRKGEFSVAGGIEQIRRLRAESTANLSPVAAPDVQKLGLTQRKLATAMEKMVERNVETLKKPELLEKFRTARTMMAKSHDVEASIDPGSGRIDPRRLAVLESEKPLSGEIKALAQISKEFPASVEPPQLIASDKPFTERSTPMSILHPKALGAHLSARFIDPVRLSRPYQSMFVDPRNKMTPEQQRIMRLLYGAQIAPPPDQ